MRRETAFPYDQAWGHPGISIRDYFAAAAMHKLKKLAADTPDANLWEQARFCYRIADAMLKARGEEVE